MFEPRLKHMPKYEFSKRTSCSLYFEPLSAYPDFDEAGAIESIKTIVTKLADTIEVEFYKTKYGLQLLRLPIVPGVGFAASEAVFAMPSFGRELALEAVIPYENISVDFGKEPASESDQESEFRERYFNIINRCLYEKIVIHRREEYSEDLLIKYLTQSSNYVLAFWSGEDSAADSNNSKLLDAFAGINGCQVNDYVWNAGRFELYTRRG